MKQIYTSYYGRKAGDPNSVSISASAPHYFSGDCYKQLAPNWELVRSYKEGEITEDQYRVAYIALLESRNLTPQSVADVLPDKVILLCYEIPTDFCHRHILAKWITDSTDTVVTEWMSEETNQQIEFTNSFMDFD